MYVSYYNTNGAASTAGFYSGFTKPPKFEIKSEFAAKGNCVNEDGSSNIELTAEIADGWLPFMYSPTLGDEFFNQFLDKGFEKSGDPNKKDTFNIQVTLHLKVKRNLWRAFIKPGRKCKVGECIIFKNNLKAKLIEKFVEGDVLLEFNKGDQSLLKEVHHQGEMPLPPYIKSCLLYTSPSPRD